jgi:hypothetical protein
MHENESRRAPRPSARTAFRAAASSVPKMTSFAVAGGEVDVSLARSPEPVRSHALTAATHMTVMRMPVRTVRLYPMT